LKRGIDHLVLCVSDLDRAIALYRNLGFATTPRAQHPWGTDNSLIQLQSCFLELLTVSRPELIEPASERFFSFGAFSRQFLERREGMSMLVFESSDASADREEFAARGFHPWDLFHFERQAKLPDGLSVRVAFSLAFATDPRMPEVAFFCCQQHAPQYFWKPEYQSHANGAETIEKVVMVAAEPVKFADFFSRIQEPESVVTDSGSLTVSTPRGRLFVLTPEAARGCFEGVEDSFSTASPSFFGFSIRVPALDRVASILDANSVGFTSTGEAIRVCPEEAFGVAIEFVARPEGK
jgi:catechol 2,3-dioxygenase-like lactoylglutathione lyase family enzyme